MEISRNIKWIEYASELLNGTLKGLKKINYKFLLPNLTKKLDKKPI
jgi:hypothetical protein